MPNDIAAARAKGHGHQRRLWWALKESGGSIPEALERDHSQEAVRMREMPSENRVRALATLIMERGDPTSNKRFTAWLVREYAAGRLLLEDVGTANETLSLFLRYAPRLKPEQRDIQRYASLSAAWEAVRGFFERDEVHSNKAQKALDRAKAYEESRILRQDPDGFTVAVPLTEFAAKWWGKGTRWCTAAAKNNVFWSYHRQAPLIVMFIPEWGKCQIWVTQDNFQLMDAADHPLSIEAVQKNWTYFSVVFSWILGQNGLALARVPEPCRFEDLCRAAVAQHGWALEDVPENLKTDEMCEIAVTQYALALEFVPEHLRNMELCLTAVTKIGAALQYVPAQYRTIEMCRLALMRNGNAIHYVPDTIPRIELAQIAVKQTATALSYLGRPEINEELCRMAVMAHGDALEWVPQEFQTEEICRLAVAQNGDALRHVPETRKTAEICHLAVANHRNGILHAVPERLRDEALCEVAVKASGRSLEHVPYDLKTEDLCRIAVMQNGFAFKWVPARFRTEEICRSAVASNAEVLALIPVRLRTMEICRIAVTNDGFALRNVPGRLRNEEICRIAISQTASAAPWVPERLRNQFMPAIGDTPDLPTWETALLDGMEAAFCAAQAKMPTPHAKSEDRLAG